jgi:hypothetical protein
VLTVARAALLLQDAADLPRLAALARAVGCDGPVADLDRAACEALGIASYVEGARVVAGRGALRALTAVAPPGGGTRERVVRLASQVAARSPYLAWLVLVAERDGATRAIACPRIAGARVTAVIARRDQVLESDAETVRAIAAAATDGPDVLVHQRWHEVLGRDALSHRFFRDLEAAVGDLGAHAHGRVPDAARRDLALTLVSRLLFLAFIEAKGWLNGDPAFLAHTYRRCTGGAGGFHRRVLLPLFFGTLNTPPARRAATARAFGRIPFLNGGLFQRTPLERAYPDAVIDDAAIGRCLGDVFDRYRFTARETSGAYSEAAIDPEMLGRAFESLMASHERRAAGVYFTPHALVARLVHQGLARVCASAGDATAFEALASGVPVPPGETALLRARLSALRVVDPACGSGAFLVHTLEELARLLRRAGDPRATADLRRDIAARQVFGVDRAPMAVWLCELRLWLSVVIEREVGDPRDVPALPNLDRNVRVGDALAGAAFPADAGMAAGVAALRWRYARATGPRKRTLGAALDRAERRAAIAACDAERAAARARRRELLTTLRGRDLFGARRAATPAERMALRHLKGTARNAAAQAARLARGAALPFAWGSGFADVAAHGGFDLVVGNPPWVRLHRIPPAERTALRARFRVLRDAAWRDGAAAAGAGAGFGGQADLAALFVERGLALARPGGSVALLVPLKLWRALAGGGVRSLVRDLATLDAVEDWSDASAAFDAVTYPSVLVATRRPFDGGAAGVARVAVRRRDDVIVWDATPAQLAFDDSPGAPWLAIPPAPRRAFDRLRLAGPALGETAFGRPRLGVKCGVNDAFLVAVERAADGHAAVRAGARAALLEKVVLRPVLRGEDVRAFAADAGDRRIVWPHDAHLRPLASLPPLTARWLAPARHRLEARADGGTRGPWWALFRVDAADASRPRVVWADLGRVPRAAVLPAGDPTVPLNTCYVVHAPSLADADALATLLNAPPVAAWLAELAEPARGGYRRFQGWVVARLPLPTPWNRVRGPLAALGAAARAGRTPDPIALIEAACRAYRVRVRDLEPLLAWTAR